VLYPVLTTYLNCTSSACDDNVYSIVHGCSVMDVTCGEVMSTSRSHGDAITGLALMPDAASLVTASGDANIHVWELPASVSIRCQASSQVTKPKASDNPSAGGNTTKSWPLPDYSSSAEDLGTKTSVGALPSHASLMSTCTSPGESFMGEPPPFTFKPDCEGTVAKETAPPPLQMPTEECGDVSDHDHENENLTSAQKQLMELLSPQAVPKVTPRGSEVRPSMSSIFRIKDGAVDGAGTDYVFGRRKKRFDQAWSQQQLSLLDEFQSDLKVPSLS
jgi:WD40 repeat protein